VSFELRPYQIRDIERLHASFVAGHRAPLYQLATGGGKTVVFCEITRRTCASGRRVLVTVHRRELVKQSSDKLQRIGVPHGIIAAGFPAAPGLPVQICSINTAIRRDIGRFDLIIPDKAHHCRAAMWQQLFASQPDAAKLGVTATPERLDGKGLDDVFDDLICGPSIAELIADGYLAPGQYFVPPSQVDLTGLRTQAGDWIASQLAERVDQKTITGDAVEQYRKHADHQPAIVFCATVAHAEHVAAMFCEAGYRAASVDGSMAMGERDRRIAGLGTGEIEVLTSCDLISEGLDVPSVGAIILLRPTKSIVIHFQQIGRGMRPAPGKEHLIVLDHVGNIRRHGRPDEPRAWSLSGAEKKPGGQAPEKICPNCYCANRANATECEACGFVFAKPRAEPIVVPGELVAMPSHGQLPDLRTMSFRRALRWAGADEHRLHMVARARGYKPGWVFYRLQELRQGGAL
jgi:DNA repair protein RadD